MEDLENNQNYTLFFSFSDNGQCWNSVSPSTTLIFRVCITLENNMRGKLKHEVR